MSNWLSTLYHEIRPNFIYDLIKWIVIAGLSLIGLFVYRLLVWGRQLPEDRVIDAAVFIGAVILLLTGYLLAKYKRVSETTGPRLEASRGIKQTSKAMLGVLAVLGITLIGILILVATAPRSPVEREKVAQESPSPISTPLSSPKPFDIKDLEEIRNRSFANERVDLDGKRYIGCTFTNVKLVYNGGRYALEHNTFVGKPWVRSENEAVSGAMGLLKGIGAITPDFPLVGLDGKPLESVEPMKMIYSDGKGSKSRSN